MRNMNRGCSGCNHNNHCNCGPVVERELICRDEPTFCVAVTADYTAEGDDENIHVVSNAGMPGGVGTPTVTLPAGDDVERNCASLTITAQETPVIVAGLNDTTANPASDGTRYIAAFTAVTFFLSEPAPDSDPDPCTDTSYWIAQGITSTAP